ncbi:D-alanine--D-alanine ligase [Micropruina sp.]|uniref:D-alanine--D-alanine ligase family protein n=1 Tax=Micropruina sp. TaxID=2737536 RepID=UPI002634D2CD|nr:D-alanine--D-alanine ligase [Micropruina sp.]
MSSQPGTVVVLAGGLSHERDVSLRSGRRVAQALRDQGLSVIEADVTRGLAELLAATPDAVVFPVLHGGDGEDGSLREVLDLFGVPYVGSTGPASQRAFDKSICTPLLEVTKPAQVALPNSVFRELGAQALVAALVERLGLPLIVKPNRSGSALGCTKVSSAAALPGAMVAAYAYGEMAVIEQFIEGTEVAVTVVDTGDGPRALPAVEIRPRSGVYDYTARYTAGETRFICPAELDDDVAQACADLALRVHGSLGLRDLSRTDIIVGPDGPVFIETNVSPGMTETSLVPLAVEAAGEDFGRLCAALVRQAYSRGPSGVRG